MPTESPEATVMSVPSLRVRVSSESVARSSEAVMVVTSPSVRESEASCSPMVVTSSKPAPSSAMVRVSVTPAVSRDSKPPPANPDMERVSTISALV